MVFRASNARKTREALDEQQPAREQPRVQGTHPRYLSICQITGPPRRGTGFNVRNRLLSRAYVRVTRCPGVQG